MSNLDDVAGCRLIRFRAIGDDRGWLTPLEVGREIPFTVQRTYFIYGTRPEVHRGMHAHRDLEQVAVCVSGSCTFLVDSGRSRQKIQLNDPATGLYIGSMVWREMFDFSTDCVLLVLASRLYDEADYIRDYETFCMLRRDAKE